MAPRSHHNGEVLSNGLQLPNQLRNARKVRGLSQRAAADLAGVDVSWLSRAESGQRGVPTDESLDRLVAALGVEAVTARQLKLAARMDRVLQLCQEQIPDCASIVSAALDAGTVLDGPEAEGVARTLTELARSKRQLVRFRSIAETQYIPLSKQEGAMS